MRTFIRLLPQGEVSMKLLWLLFIPTLAFGQIIGRSGFHVPQATATAAALTDSLKAYWCLNEASGTRYDTTANIALSDYGTTGDSTGVIDSSMSVDAADEWLSLTDPGAAIVAFGNVDFTIQFWIYPTELTGLNGILGRDESGKREYCFYTNGTALNFRIGTGASDDMDEVTADSALAVGRWFHVLGWYSATTESIYVQVNGGAVKRAATPTVTPAVGTSAFYVGRFISTSYPFLGRLDEIAFWKRNLTASERTALYNSGAGKAYGTW